MYLYHSSSFRVCTFVFHMLNRHHRILNKVATLLRSSCLCIYEDPTVIRCKYKTASKTVSMIVKGRTSSKEQTKSVMPSSKTIVERFLDSKNGGWDAVIKVLLNGLEHTSSCCRDAYGDDIYCFYIS